jgi:hypothetical protein
VRVLAPEDLLLHLSIQASEDRCVGMLKRLCDIDHAVHRCVNRMNWPLVGEHAVLWGGQHSAYLTLYLARELLGVAVPDAVLDELRPDQFDPRLPVWALDRLLSRSSESQSLGPRFMRLWRAGSYRQRILGLLTMIFPSPEVVAEHYGVRADSRRVYYFYLVRLKNEFFRTYRPLRRLLTREPATRAAAEEDKVLTEWLESA